MEKEAIRQIIIEFNHAIEFYAKVKDIRKPVSITYPADSKMTLQTLYSSFVSTFENTCVAWEDGDDTTMIRAKLLNSFEQIRKDLLAHAQHTEGLIEDLKKQPRNQKAVALLKEQTISSPYPQSQS